MKKRSLSKKQHLNQMKINKINQYERMFSVHNYNGKGQRYVGTVQGKAAVAICAPWAVNHLCDSVQSACKYSGGLVKLLANETGCNALYIKKVYSNQNMDSIITEIRQYLIDSHIKFLIDIQVNDNSGDDFVIELSTDSIPEKYVFVEKIIQYSFEHEYIDDEIRTIVKLLPNRTESVSAKAAKAEGLAYICINLKDCNPSKKSDFLRIYNVLSKIFNMLSHLDWNAEKIRTYRLWQSLSHKPQDKIEIISIPDQDFSYCDLLNIYSYGAGSERVRLHKPDTRTIDELVRGIGAEKFSQSKDEYIFLTNRLIGLLFGREWIEGNEQRAGLRGAPVIVYYYKRESYPIGLPKANQIDGIYFSSVLYEDKQTESELYDYEVFNRYTDSCLHINFIDADYADFGRIKDENGMRARKIMIPRYYKRLLGYLDYPLTMIRNEEYETMLEGRTEEEKEAFKACYELMEGEIFHYLKENLNDEQKDQVVKVQKKLGLFNNVELLKIPKKVKSKHLPHTMIWCKINEIRMWILEKMIGKAEYLLRVEWTSETDDKNNTARLSSSMMCLLGVSEVDKILVRFGDKCETLRVLENDGLTDYQIGLPAPTRKKLGMNSINDIIIVHRDMKHIFWRHSEEQIIAILGTVLAVFQVINRTWLGVVLSILLIPLMMYFVLNRERVKVK